MEKVIKEETPKKWEFKKLKATHVFLLLPVLKKIGINNIKRCMSGDIVKGIIADNENKAHKAQVDAATFGAILEFGQIMIEGLDGAENQIFNLLAGTSNLSRGEVEDLSMGELIAMIMDFVKLDDFKQLFKEAQLFLK